MLPVPRYRQRDPISCLPTCVHAVLEYRHGENAITYEDVFEACCLDSKGAVVDLAIQGLQEAGWDLGILTYQDLASIKELVDIGDPVVVIRAVIQQGSNSLGHAVVVCALDDSSITVMDPAVGDYITLALADNDLLETEIIQGFTIAGFPASNAR